MTLQQINTMVKSFGVPSAYYQFEEGSGQQCPFVVFYYPNRNDFAADNKNYAKITALTIELYTDEKDFSLEATIEGKLDAQDLAYTKEEEYIDSERMYMVTYSMEVLING